MESQVRKKRSGEKDVSDIVFFIPLNHLPSTDGGNTVARKRRQLSLKSESASAGPTEAEIYQ